MRILLICLAALTLAPAPGLLAQTANTPPELILSPTNISYVAGNGPRLLDTNAVVRDADSPNFDGGRLTVDFVTDGTPEDRLGIRNQGAGPGHIFTSGSTVSYATQPIGTFFGGTNGASALVVTFNGKATPEAVEALARSLTYEHQANSPPPALRRLRLVLTDGDGGTSAPAFVQIRVMPSNRPPVAVFQVFPRVFLVGLPTNGAILSANNSNAVVVLDASLSTDGDHDVLTFSWFDGPAVAPFATGSMVTNRFAAGLHPIRLQVSDGHAVTEALVDVEIITPGEALEGSARLVRQSGLSRQRAQPLMATLKSAGATFERGQFTAAANQLKAFENKMRAQLTPADAALATALTQNIEKILETIGGH